MRISAVVDSTTAAIIGRSSHAGTEALCPLGKVQTEHTNTVTHVKAKART